MKKSKNPDTRELPGKDYPPTLAAVWSPDIVYDIFGGRTAFRGATGFSINTVRNWQRAIPQKHFSKIYETAKKLALPLEWSDLSEPTWVYAQQHPKNSMKLVADKMRGWNEGEAEDEA